MKFKPDVIATLRNIVKHFNHFSVPCFNLSIMQTKKLNESAKKLTQNMSTRWNSAYYMLEHLLEKKCALALCVTENGEIQNMPSTQSMILENVFYLLQPFEEVTKLSSSETIIPKIILNVSTLKDI